MGSQEVRALLVARKQLLGRLNAGGYCTISNSAGDQAYLSFKCEGDGVHCNGPFEYTGGTGKYAGITGSNYVFSATTEVNWQDDTVTGLSTWNR